MIPKNFKELDILYQNAILSVFSDITKTADIREEFKGRAT